MLLLIIYNANTDSYHTVYIHTDKQPPMSADWSEGLSPWTPVLKDGKLYGRGGADDGYSTYAAITAIKALQLQNISYARCVILIEGSEESGSVDLPCMLVYYDILYNCIHIMQTLIIVVLIVWFTCYRLC